MPSTDRPACHVFAGPTGAALPKTLWQRDDVELVVHPPAARHDIESLVNSSPPATIALVDGRFYHCLAVGHAELRTALQREWTVWGLSSLGAIRAAEMATLGMRGFGRVARAYAHLGLDDDEVTLLHDITTPYLPRTLSMVQVRAYVAALVDGGIITSEQSATVLAQMKNRWFGERSIALLRHLLTTHSGLGSDDVTAEAIAPFDEKAQDLRDFLGLPASELVGASPTG